MLWSELLSDIRADLQDTATAPRWSDKMLYVYVKDAVRDISVWFPRRVDTLSMLAVNGSFLLPSDFIEEIQLECPIGTVLEKRQTRPGVRYRPTYQPKTFYVSGGKIYVSAPTNEVFLTYNSAHPVPASETDLTFVFTIQDIDSELVRLYTKARVYGQMRSRQAGLDRFKVAGTRDDNPLIPETDDIMKEYREKIAQRFPGGVITLYRLGVLK